MGVDSIGRRRSRAIAKATEMTIRHGSRGPCSTGLGTSRAGRGVPTQTLIQTLTWVMVVEGGGRRGEEERQSNDDMYTMLARWPFLE
jgi:hypothetical protein